MKIQYFPDTDTLLLDMGEGIAARTESVSEDVLIDFDATGKVLGITIEHAAKRMDLTSLETIDLPGTVSRAA